MIHILSLKAQITSLSSTSVPDDPLDLLLMLYLLVFLTWLFAGSGSKHRLRSGTQTLAKLFKTKTAVSGDLKSFKLRLKGSYSHGRSHAVCTQSCDCRVSKSSIEKRSRAGVGSVHFLSAFQLKFPAPPAQITQLRIKHQRRSIFKRRKHLQEPSLGQMTDPNLIREAQIDVSCHIRTAHVH